MSMVFQDFMRFQRFYEILKTSLGFVGNLGSTPLPPLPHTADTPPDQLQVDTDNLLPGVWPLDPGR